MARKPRVEFDGALYHVIVRGNHRRDIFRDTTDQVTYLERIEHCRERYYFRVYAYVLMSNHVHLLIETGVVGLSKIMRGIQFSYTQRYNRRHRMVGHLFRGRDKAILCDSRCVFVGAGSLYSFEPGADETSTRSLAISLEQSSVIRRSRQSGQNSDKRCAEAVRV
jgi:REP element-mobilizing transposase RayT